MKLFNRQGLGRTLLLAAVLVVGSVCVSNGDNPSALAGQWVNVANGVNIELFKDGTGVGGNTSLTWKTEGKRFVYSIDNSTFVSDYNLSGYELTHTKDDGGVMVWVRKDNVEEYKKKKEKETEQRVEKMSSYFTDSRNGQKYRAVKIGRKTWMAENLNYQTGNSWCYDGNNSNCEKYGRLYDWSTAKTVCPTGWHLPSRDEWGALAIAAGGTYAYGDGGKAGTNLKSKSGWDNKGNGTDILGFSALPGGGHNFDGLGTYVGGIWWTATEVSSRIYGNANAYGRNIGNHRDSANENEYDKRNGFSVRCVQD